MTTKVVNTHDAKSRLSELIREAERGVEVIVARNGVPVARIVPWTTAPPTRQPGRWSGRVTYQADIVSPDPDVAELFDAAASGPM
jgi:prevent-host-death family protein